MISEKILSAYETMAEKYNELIDHKPHNAYYDRPNTMRLIPEAKGKKVLDAACGPGKYAEILLAQGAEVTGIDFSPKMIDLAKQRNPTSGEFFVHDMSKAFSMFETNTFDIVLCALALHYLEDWNPTIREFHRVLKPGACLVVSLEHPFFEYNYFKSTRYFEVEPVKCTWNGFGQAVEVHSYRRSLGECISSFTNNGFYIDKLVEPKPLPEFEKFDPEYFKRLNEFPAFMCIRAVPRS